MAVPAPPYAHRDLIDAHVEACGRSNINPMLIEWSMIAVLAALLQDRAGIRLDETLDVMPLNQMVVLISPTGSGKGRAVRSVLRLVRQSFEVGKDIHGNPEFYGVTPSDQQASERAWRNLYFYNGTLTRAGLQDKLYEQRDANGLCQHAKLFWIAEEMRLSFVNPNVATEVITALTGYKEPSELNHEAMVRKDRRHVDIEDPCINVLAGTTWDWLSLVMGRTELSGGMLRRTFFVDVPYDMRDMTMDFAAPADRHQIWASLQERIRHLAVTNFGGSVIQWDPDTEATFKRWFMAGQRGGVREHDTPDDQSSPMGIMYGNRMSEASKLMALSAVSRWDHRVATGPPRIEQPDFERGLRWWQQAYETMPKLSMELSGSNTAKSIGIASRVLAELSRKTKFHDGVPEAIWADFMVQQGLGRREMEEAILSMEKAYWMVRKYDEPQKRWLLRWIGKQGGKKAK